eukprot:8045808-Pyramimonas_sp.AAC.1
MRDKDATALDAHFEACRAGRGQRKWRRIDRGGKDEKTFVARRCERFSSMPRIGIAVPTAERVEEDAEENVEEEEG